MDKIINLRNLELGDGQSKKLRECKKDGNNLLTATESNDITRVELLIQSDIDVNYRDRMRQQTAIDIAWCNGFYEIMFALLEADSIFPVDFTLDAMFSDPEIPQFLKDLVRCREELGSWIKNNELEKIKDFISNQKSTKLMNSNNCSALEIAAKIGAEDSLLLLIGFESHIQSERPPLSKSQFILLNDTKDKEGNSLLALAAGNGKEVIVSLLISCGLDINCCNTFGEKAVDLAWKNKHYQVVLRLLKADSDFPEGFNLENFCEPEADNEQIQLIKEFVNARDTLHKSISEGNFQDVENFILSNDVSKLYLNFKGTSAVFTALQAKQYNIYSYFKSIGLEFRNENENVIDELSVGEKVSIKEAMIPFFPSFNNAHILYLISKSRPQAIIENFQGKVKSYYEKLDSIPLVSKILQVIQYADYLDIVFDFKNENIKDSNPTASDTAKGTTDYKEGRLYIAAKIDEETLLGTLAQELTHLAMEMMYQNDCNPYKLNDCTSQQSFNEITVAIQNLDFIKRIIHDFEKGDVADSPRTILARAFLYPQNEQESELIVRIPHILSQYGKQIGEELFSEPLQIRRLFEFYNEKIVPFCDKFIEQSFFIKPRNTVKFINESLGDIIKIRECDISFKEFIDLKSFIKDDSGSNIFILPTDNTWLTILRIYQPLQASINENYLILNFNNYLKHSEAVNKAFYSIASSLLILEYVHDKKYDKKFLSQHFATFQALLSERKKKYIFFVINECNEKIFKEFKVKFIHLNTKVTLNDLVMASQEKLLSKKIEIQNTTVVLRDVIDATDENCKKIIDGDILVKLISDQPIEIGKEFRLYNKYYNREMVYIEQTLNMKVSIERRILKDKEKGNFPDKLVFTEADFETECQNNKEMNIHWLENKYRELIWQKSYGSIKNLIPYRNNNVDQLYKATQDDYISNEEKMIKFSGEHKTVIISGKPGMGKSAYLINLFKQIKRYKPTSWVIGLDLNCYSDTLWKEMRSRKRKPCSFINDNSGQAVTFLLGQLLKLDQSKFERKLLEYCFTHKHNIILLFDGFDEISPNYKTLVIELIQGLTNHVEQMWVTSRRNMQPELESSLNVFSFMFNPLSESEQIMLLVKYWRVECNPEKYVDSKRLEAYAKSVIDLLTWAIRDKEKEFTGVPLQLRMVAEIVEKPLEIPNLYADLTDDSREIIQPMAESLEEFYDSSLEKPNITTKLFSQVDLYKLFIYKKYCDVYEVEKKGSNLCNLATGESIIKHYPTFIKEHDLLALSSLFSRRKYKTLLTGAEMRDIESLITAISEGKERRGIIDLVAESKPHFVHQTFAEYFVSDFLITQLLGDTKSSERIQKFLVVDILLKEENNVIRSFFNGHLRNIPEDSFEVENIIIESAKWAKDENGNSVLHLAVAEENIDIVRFILTYLNSPEDFVNSINKEGLTALHYAAENGNLNCVNLLIENGADINAVIESKKKKFGSTVLYTAAQRGHEDIVKCLLDHGADINAFLIGHKTYAGFNLLHLAAYEGDLSVTKILVENGVNRSICVRDGEFEGLLALHLAAIRGYWHIFEWFLQNHHFDVNTIVKNGKYSGTSLFNILAYNPFQVSENLWNWLKDLNVDVNAKDIDGNSPCHTAIIGNKLLFVKWLCKNGADINSTNKAGQTPLHLAVTHINEDSEIIKWLLNHGSDIYAKDCEGDTALDLANSLHVHLLMGYVINGY